MTFFRLFIFAIATLLLIGCDTTTVKETQLHTNWVFKKKDSNNWKKANVPGTVNTDLIANNNIKNPFYRLNEHDLQWIDKSDWEYKTTFNLTKEDLAKQYIEIEFRGLDTYAKIYLNDQLVQETDNMFRTYTLDLKPFVKEKENTLKVVLESPINRGIKKHDAINYKIPVSNNDLAEIGKVPEQKLVSIFSRKAGYHFGWDWGPRLVTSGIWRSVTLRSWDNFKINDVFLRQKKIDSTARLTAQIELTTVKAFEKSTIEINVGDITVKTTEQSLKSGKNTLSIPFEIKKPELWWPNGMGNQKLYTVNVKVTANKHTDSKSHRIGLRTIELITEKDSIGSNFYFKVNGKATFMKGANYIPQDVFLTRVESKNYKHILTSAKEANMNMLRVWGGGIYENDEFYKLCDEMGLLVWQDFMFACAMFPGNKAFLENVKQEAIDNVKRLRNHTSIALWCGNNEILSAWENWGWKKDVEKKQSKAVADTIWKAYTDIFHKILPEVVNEYDSDRRYWASSPSTELGVPESFDKGDAHYWSVWWGKEPFENYNVKIPRFMSEFGFQSFPELTTVNKYTIPEDHDIFSDVMKSHQRSTIGNGTIEEYMLRHYKKPKDFSSFLYVSQLLQAYGITTGIEAHRKNRKRCMGSLYWQINDCWPVASWSSIDYYGKWKALHYGVKKSFKNTILSFDKKQDSIVVHIATDDLKDKKALMDIIIYDFEGNEIKKWSKDVTIMANASNVYYTIPKADLAAIKPKYNQVFISAKLSTEEVVLDEKITFLLPFKDLELPEPKIDYTVSENETNYIVTITNDNLAIGVYASGNFEENFSDNYFNMLPKSKKTIIIKKGDIKTLKAFDKALEIISLTDSYHQNIP